MLPANIKIRLTAHFPAEIRTSDQFPKPFKTALRVRKDNRSLKYVPKLNTAGSTFSSNSFSPLLTEINYKILESNLIQRGNEFFFFLFLFRHPTSKTQSPAAREVLGVVVLAPARSFSQGSSESNRAERDLPGRLECGNGKNVHRIILQQKKERASNSFFRGSWLCVCVVSITGRTGYHTRSFRSLRASQPKKKRARSKPEHLLGWRPVCGQTCVLGH